MGIFLGPVTSSSEFGKLGYFDMFIKVSVFHKYYFIYRYFRAETVFDTDEVRMTSLEGTNFIFSYRVTRK